MRIGIRATILFALSAMLAMGIWLLWVHRCGPTIYAQVYTEVKFRSIHVGMTYKEVEAILGKPLQEVHWEDRTVLWTYSDRADKTCDFERRWLYFEKGKVAEIDNDYWEE